MNVHLMQALQEEPREARLPEWVKDKLHTLRYLAKHSSAELVALKQGSTPSEFFLENWADSENKFYLPSGHRLMFKSGYTHLDIHGQRSDAEKGLLTIYSLENGLIVRPHANNVVTLESAKR